ncbi:MAG: CpXC domain-containing protein [Anaerolineae bacterium]
MPETNAIQITCPQCGNVYQAPVRTVIDVGQNPQLRQAFLAGQLNLAVCPKCQTGLAIEVPLVYHDPGAEFLAVYFPQQLNIPEMERQKMIGEMTQALMRSLPPEQRKGYFLSPRQFLSRQALVDAVLGTMGISQEELDRQRKKMKLLDQLRIMADDPKGLEMMLKGQDAQIDHEFFLLLSGALQSATATGDAKTADQLRMLADRLKTMTTYGRRVAKQEAAVASLKEIKSADEFFDRVVRADLDEAEAIAVAARPLLDYAFFQRLTGQIEAAAGEERERLTRLRSQLVKVTEQMDEAARASMQEATTLLQELLASPEPRSAVREHADEIDDVFMAVLQANMREAERRNARAALDRMSMIYDEIMALYEEGMPPEVQLINELLQESYPDGTRDLLQERRQEITPELLELMDQLAEEMAQRGTKEFTDVAKRLRDIKAQATLLV